MIYAALKGRIQSGIVTILNKTLFSRNTNQYLYRIFKNYEMIGSWEVLIISLWPMRCPMKCTVFPKADVIIFRGACDCWYRTVRRRRMIGATKEEGWSWK